MFVQISESSILEINLQERKIAEIKAISRENVCKT